MLENFIWKNVFLPNFIKKEIVSFYENKCQNPYLNKQGYQSFKKFIIYHLCNRIHKSWFNEKDTHYNIPLQAKKYLENSNIPMSFWLIIAKTQKANKLKKLLEWGLSVKNPLIKEGVEINLLHQVIWAYHESLISLEDTKEIITILIEKNISLFKKYKISHYEKTNDLLRKENFTNSISANKAQNKLVDLIHGWLDKELYTFIINSNLNEEDKNLLEYITLKQKVHTIYIENYSGNIRKSGYEIISRQISVIESVIQRGYVFFNQSTTYNALSLLLNLPDFTELLNNQSILKCYEKFSHLGVIAKKSLTYRLINKNKETIIFNLLNYGIELNWTILTEDEKSILGLKLVCHEDFLEYVINDITFNIKVSNLKGENILHTLQNIFLNNDNIKKKLKDRINMLSDIERDFLLYQYDIENQTPMIKAINQKNYLMVDFLIEIGNSGINDIVGIELPYNSPVNYLETQINEEDKSEEYLNNILQKWKIEKNYQKMLKTFPKKEKKQKLIKI